MSNTQKPPAVRLNASTLNPKSYARKLRCALAAHAARMQEEWGACPGIEVTLEMCLVVRTHFNMKGFAHNTGRTYVSAKHAAGYRSPKKVADGIVAELVVHRDTCRACGEGLVPLYTRRRCLLNLLDREAARGHGPPYFSFMDPADGKAYGPYYDRQPSLSVLRRLILRPADAVERALHPRLAAELDRLIKEYCQQNGVAIPAGPVCPLPSHEAA
jgi:hypothetical protein